MHIAPPEKAVQARCGMLTSFQRCCVPSCVKPLPACGGSSSGASGTPSALYGASICAAEPNGASVTVCTCYNRGGPSLSSVEVGWHGFHEDPSSFGAKWFVWCCVRVCGAEPYGSCICQTPVLSLSHQTILLRSRLAGAPGTFPMSMTLNTFVLSA